MDARSHSCWLLARTADGCSLAKLMAARSHNSMGCSSNLMALILQADGRLFLATFVSFTHTIFNLMDAHTCWGEKTELLCKPALPGGWMEPASNCTASKCTASKMLQAKNTCNGWTDRTCKQLHCNCKLNTASKQNNTASKKILQAKKINAASKTGGWMVEPASNFTALQLQAKNTASKIIILQASKITNRVSDHVLDTITDWTPVYMHQEFWSSSLDTHR